MRQLLQSGDTQAKLSQIGRAFGEDQCLSRRRKLSQLIFRHPVPGKIGAKPRRLLRIIGDDDQGPFCVPLKLCQHPAFRRERESFQPRHSAGLYRLSKLQIGRVVLRQTGQFSQIHTRFSPSLSCLFRITCDAQKGFGEYNPPKPKTLRFSKQLYPFRYLSNTGWKNCRRMQTGGSASQGRLLRGEIRVISRRIAEDQPRR